MDERMRDAAEAGDIEALYALIQENSFVLESIDRFPFIETPLHIAASKGHIDFAMEMMNLKPSYARKLNPTGLSPMHLALLNCQVHVVRELLKVDKDLVRVKGKGSWTPLHYAVEKGNLDLIAEFLEACPQCITDVTIQGQNAIHIAISNNNFETLELVVCWLEKITHKDADIWNKQVLNGIDCGGNTVLHIAASINHPQMVRLLLECKMISKNKVNLNGQSALDMLPGQVNNNETANILSQAGCLEAKRIPARQTLAESLRTRISWPKKLRTTVVRQNNKISNDMRNAMLVVATLILTATYQTCLSPPGGVWQGNLGDRDSGDPMLSRSNLSPPGGVWQGNLGDHNSGDPMHSRSNLSPSSILLPPPPQGLPVFEPSPPPQRLPVFERPLPVFEPSSPPQGLPDFKPPPPPQGLPVFEPSPPPQGLPVFEPSPPPQRLPVFELPMPVFPAQGPEPSSPPQGPEPPPQGPEPPPQGPEPPSPPRGLPDFKPPPPPQGSSVFEPPPPPNTNPINATESKAGLSIMSTPNFIYFYFINTATFLTTTGVVFCLLPDSTIYLLTIPVMLFILCYLVSMTYLAPFPFPIPFSSPLQPFAPIIVATLLFLIVCLPKFLILISNLKGGSLNVSAN